MREPAVEAASALPALLVHLAEVAPDRPWLFHPQGLDWRWLARAEVAERVAARAGVLADGLGRAGVEAGAPVAFRAAPDPDSVILDLALQAAGYRPVPLYPCDPAVAAEAGAAALLEAPRDGENGPEVRRLDPAAAPPPPLAPADLLQAARRLAAPAATLPFPTSPDEPPSPSPSTPPAPRPRGGHEVTVAGHPFASPGQRLLVAWTLVTGGALVLEGQPGVRVSTASWARPTLFLGTAEELDRLRGTAESFRRGDLTGRLRRRLDRLLHRNGVGREGAADLPFRRLHTVVRTGPAGGGTAEDFFRRRGVRVLALDDLLP